MLNQTLLVFGTYGIISGITYYIVRLRMRVPELVTPAFSLVLITFLLYILDIFLKNPILKLFFVVIIITISSFYLHDLSDKDSEKISFRYYLLTAVLTFIINLPRIIYFKCLLEGSACVFIRFLDEDKHLSILTGLTTSSSYTPFIYKPDEHFIYYYLYYLFPGTLLRMFDLAHKGSIWTIHILYCYTAFILCSVYLFKKLARNFLIRIWGMFLLLFGTNLKLIPQILSRNIQRTLHIEAWYMTDSDYLQGLFYKRGWQFSHPIVLANWVPQHLFALLGVIIFIIVFLYFKKKIQNAIVLAAILTVIFGSSVFIGLMVSLTYLLILVWYARYHKNILLLVISGVLFGVFIFPFILFIRNNPSQIIFHPNIPVINSYNCYFSILVFYLIETGVFIPLLSILLYFRLMQKKKFELIFYIFLSLTIIPLVFARLFQTTQYNDFSMRVHLLFIVFAPFFIVYLIDSISFLKRNFVYILWITIIPIILSMSAGMLEIYYRLNTAHLIQPIYKRTFYDIQRHTNNNDIILSNNELVNIYMPVLYTRLSIAHQYNELEPYILKPELYGKVPFSVFECNIYNKIYNKISQYNYVYAQFNSLPSLKCHKNFTKLNLIYSSDGLKLFRIPK